MRKSVVSSSDQEKATISPEMAQVKRKQPFSEPKLTFIMPKLVKRGGLEDITAGFFGTFYP